MDTRERVKVANELAFSSALDAPIRGLAAEIVGDTRNMYKDAPRRLVRWIKRNIRYTREAVGVEVLQGPYTTLRIRTADCDDYAILLVALARSIGLDYYVTGVATTDDVGTLHHAIVYDADTGNHYECTDDTAYGGTRPGSIYWRPESNLATWYYAPEPTQQGFYLSLGGNTYTRVHPDVLRTQTMTTMSLQQRSGTHNPFSPNRSMRGPTSRGFSGNFGQNYRSVNTRNMQFGYPTMGRRANPKGAPSGGGDDLQVGGGGGGGGFFQSDTFSQLLESGTRLGEAALDRPDTYQVGQATPSAMTQTTGRPNMMPWIIGGGVAVGAVVLFLALRK